MICDITRPNRTLWNVNAPYDAGWIYTTHTVFEDLINLFQLPARPCLAGWIWLRNTVPAEILWEKNTVPVEKATISWNKEGLTNFKSYNCILTFLCFMFCPWLCYIFCWRSWEIPLPSLLRRKLNSYSSIWKKKTSTKEWPLWNSNRTMSVLPLI